jgi:hypothetical protein
MTRILEDTPIKMPELTVYPLERAALTAGEP